MPKPSRQYDAGATVLVRERNGERELFWVRRSREVSLGGGFFAFPGGRLDAADGEFASKLGRASLDDALLVTAARELFEEAGVLLARNIRQGFDFNGNRKSLLAEETSFEAVLANAGARFDFDALRFAGRWLTPPFLPLRFDTRFYVAEVPVGQEPEVWPGELASGEWITPAAALGRWRKGTALLHPPAHHIIECLRDAPVDAALPKMRNGPHLVDYVAQRIEFQQDILLAPVRTPTLPPATHTNCIIIGRDELVVIDPASPYEDEQERLLELIQGLQAEGRKVREILLTHHHPDHVGGVGVLKKALGIPVRAHERTAELLRGEVDVDGTIAPDERIGFKGSDLVLRAIFTPGHAPGHLCFLEETSGSLIAGDMVAGIGSIVVDPPMGDMAQYIASLKYLRSLPVTSIYPAHGPVMPDGYAKIDEYIAHRAQREAQVVDAMRKAGAATPEELVPHVYADIDPSLYGLAARSLIAIVEKLANEKRAVLHSSGRYELI